jgi:hypothetical protein
MVDAESGDGEEAQDRYRAAQAQDRQRVLREAIGVSTKHPQGEGEA